MSWIDAIIMGFIQGLAEFLPISSSGHLVIFSNILGLQLSGEENLDFDAALHVATVLSTIVVLRHEFFGLCKSFFTLRNDENTRLVWKIILSCIPVAIVGLCFKDQVEAFFSGSLTIVGICLLVTAALLCFAYFFRTRTLSLPGHHYKPRNITWLDSFIIGIGQAVAVLPGLSRSGTTIATGILLGDKREQVAKFSFLMVIIPILGNALLDIVKFTGEGPDAASSVGFTALIAGFLTAFVTGCLACRWMIRVVSQGKLVYFAVYCLLVGITCLIW